MQNFSFYSLGLNNDSILKLLLIFKMFTVKKLINYFILLGTYSKAAKLGN